MRVKILLLPLVFHLVTQKKNLEKKIKKQDCILVCERNAKKKKLSHLSHIISTMHIKITAMTILYQNNNKKIKCEKKISQKCLI